MEAVPIQMQSEEKQENRRILIIDDNPAIHADFRKILGARRQASHPIDLAEAELFGAPETASVAQSQFELLSAFQGEEGVAATRKCIEQGRPIALAFVDVRMPPGLDGIETSSRLWKLDPDLQVVICTAFSDYSWEQMAEKLGHPDQLVILKKPFDTLEVMQLASALTEKWRLVHQTKRRLDQLQAHLTQKTSALEDAQREHVRIREQLQQSQKMEALGHLAGGVAHDFNNILTVIQGYHQILAAKPGLDAETLGALRQIGLAADRAAGLTRQLLTYGRKQMTQLRALDLNQVVRNLRQMLRRLIGEDILLICEFSSAPAIIQADEGMIGQILMNLACNARDAMPKGGKLTMAIEPLIIEGPPVECPPLEAPLDARPGEFICLRITDTGCGIRSEDLPHIFEPFYSTKNVGQGTGLGLCTVYGIVKQHSGWIEAASNPGEGASFRIFLPKAAQALDIHQEQRPPAAGSSGNECILLAEDEASVRELAREFLEGLGYRVLEAQSGKAALEIWERQNGAIDLLVTDIVMPDGLSGNDLASKLRASRPDLPVIYVSGYSLKPFAQFEPIVEGVNFLAKPYPLDDLQRIISERLEPRRNRPVHASAQAG